jgi:hypothetical protein
MPERIRETSLAMSSPRDFMLREGFYVGSAGFGGAIDEAAGFVGEDFDPRGGQPNLDRARLARLAWHSLVDEEWSPVQM